MSYTRAATYSSRLILFNNGLSLLTHLYLLNTNFDKRFNILFYLNVSKIKFAFAPLLKYILVNVKLCVSFIIIRGENVCVF